MSSEPKTHLCLEDFEKGLQALDIELSKDKFITAFAPIQLISAGGYLALSLFQNRPATSDLDYLLHPEWATDDDIKTPLRHGIVEVARTLNYNDDWLNDDMGLFVTNKARRILFQRALEQDIVLWKGENLVIFAAPMEWALERKMRRIYSSDRGRKADFDMSDCLAMLRWLKERNGMKVLNREYVRTLNVNTFDVIPDDDTMERIGAAYEERYSERIFG